jgi:hypothetical protein
MVKLGPVAYVPSFDFALLLGDRILVTLSVKGDEVISSVNNSEMSVGPTVVASRR